MERHRGHRETGHERKCEGRNYRHSEEWLATGARTEINQPERIPFTPERPGISRSGQPRTTKIFVDNTKTFVLSSAHDETTAAKADGFRAGNSASAVGARAIHGSRCPRSVAREERPRLHHGAEAAANYDRQGHGAQKRRATARYALAVGALVLMLASRVITFTWLRVQTNSAVRTGVEGATTWAETSTQNATALSGSRAPLAGSRSEQPLGMLWLVETWFLGVLLLSLRTAGGLILIERMRRKEIKAVGAGLHARGLALQRRMGVDRVIRYCECHRLDAPAVLGLVRAVVFAPGRGATGLNRQRNETGIR